MPLPLVLASTSPYRRDLLARLQLEFIQDSPETNETPTEGEQAAPLCERLAVAKARALAGRYPGHLIIGSDQVADCAGRLIGKPGTHANAARQLASFSGRHVDFHTGLCLLNSATGRVQVRVSRYRVHFRTLSAERIEHYLRAEQPYQCAGSFKSEGLGISLFSRCEGDDPTSLIGLPLIALVDLLIAEGHAF